MTFAKKIITKRTFRMMMCNAMSLLKHNRASPTHSKILTICASNSMQQHFKMSIAYRNSRPQNVTELNFHSDWTELHTASSFTSELTEKTEELIFTQEYTLRQRWWWWWRKAPAFLDELTSSPGRRRQGAACSAASLIPNIPAQPTVHTRNGGGVRS